MARAANKSTKKPKAKRVAKAKAKPTRKAAKATAKAKLAKPTQKAAKATTKAKPAKATQAKPTKATTTAKPAKAKPAHAKSPANPDRRAQVEAQAASRASDRAVLGSIMVPSGQLAIFDVGLVGYLPRPALEPAIVKATVPADRALDVVGAPVGKGRFADCWDHVAVVIGDGEVHHSKKLGEAGVDFARLVCMDHAALDHWQHEDSLDGKADFVFWGRDEAPLARVMGAKRVDGGYGWVDLSVEEAERKSDQVARLKSEHGWLFAADLRPHSHHFHALAAARKNPRGAGTLELAGSQLLLFFTSWGDGVFPIYLDLDGDDRPVQVRIQLATAESNAAMSAVNP